MKFIDEVVIFAKAGDGGDGAICWRRESGVPRGGPAGGDGGDGGDIILEADEGLHSLLDYKFISKLEAGKGESGRSKNKYGAIGKSIVSKVPLWTQCFDFDTGDVLADFTFHKQQVTICKGGSGGFGNTRFVSSTRQAPYFSKPGLCGEEKKILLSLKLMADVGLIGFPNAGKSTLLSRISAARPKIADYPFTTLIPQLGVVNIHNYKSFIIADIPGLIEGASQGLGLGFQFLKHLERVRILCHLIEPGSDCLNRYKIIRNELLNFNPLLCNLPEIVVLTKKDTIFDSNKEIHSLQFLNKKIPVIPISAVTGEGIDKLKNELYKMIRESFLEN